MLCLEAVEKMRRTVEAGLLCRLLYGKICSEQKIGGKFQPKLFDVGSKANAHVFLEKLAEIVGGKMDDACNCFHVDGLQKMFPNVQNHLSLRILGSKMDFLTTTKQQDANLRNGCENKGLPSEVLSVVFLQQFAEHGTDR